MLIHLFCFLQDIDRKKCKWKLNESFICSGGQRLGGKIVYFNERKGKS